MGTRKRECSMLSIQAQLVSKFPFLRLLMSSPKTDRVAHLDFLFPHSHSSLQAESWAKTVKAIDHDKDMCFVNSISYCKRQERKKHEFLVAEILHQRTGLKNQVIVDRSPQPSSDGDRDSAARASSKISSQVAAHDQIRISGCEELRAITHDFQPFIILATRTFTSPPSLLEFAVLVVVVHEHAPVYDVIQHQCYWYSDTVWRALGNDRYGPQTKESKDWINRGKYGAISVGRDSLSGIEQEFVEALNAAQREALSRKEEAEAQKQKVCNILLCRAC